MFSNKALIAQYEARIADLQAQIADLRSLVLPKNFAKTPALVGLEADAILSNRGEVININAADTTSEADLAERDAILSGTYDRIR